MGVVYIVSMSPFLDFDVVDDEPAIRRYELWLYGREVEADDLGAGI